MKLQHQFRIITNGKGSGRGGGRRRRKCIIFIYASQYVGSFLAMILIASVVRLVWNVVRPNFLVLVEDELRLQPAEGLADVLLQAQRDGEVHVVVPRDQAMVAPGPDECARLHGEGNAGPGQGVGERVDGGQHHVLLTTYQLHLEPSGRQSGWNNVVAQANVA